MKIQIISDIHLEFGEFELPEEGCDVLIAAGDIGVGTEGLEWLQTLEIPVIYVAGNHEFWGYEMLDLISVFNKLSKNSNVEYLEKASVIIDGVKFIGCTLWTDFDESDDKELMHELESTMNDFRYIFIGEEPISIEQLIQINHDSKKWLQKELAKPHKGPKVVVTHHAPSLKSWDSYHEDYLRYAYCNELDPLLKEYSIDLWVHGHIHQASDYKKHDVRIVCNPRGYKGYQLVDEFEPEKSVQL